MNKNFSIPTLGMVSTMMTTACGDPIVGDWDLSEVSSEYGGETISYSFPRNDCMEYYGYEICYSQVGSLNVDDELNAVFTFESSITYEGGGYDYTYTGDGEVTPGDEADTYTISVTDEDGDNMEMNCTLTDDTLSCDDDVFYNVENPRRASSHQSSVP